ncbi:TetR/AcrR family transcriptional regulator [Pseudonocardia aurantiaca]|uniref:TetR/AcrR family transcriptional regulator n=1 Tax=Pseudonocardia aurantiaca TaxID=75290 RepID=A0ABW4FPN3_9PSEU
MATGTIELNRERMVAVAAEVFARHGYHGTGIAELAKAVGLGRGALYHYIESKEALLYAISRTQVDRMNAHAETTLRAGYAPEELLHEMARGLVRNIAEHRAEWAVFFSDYSALTGERRDHVIAARERYEGYWRQALDRGVAAGVLRATPELLVKGILGMLNYTYLWFEPDGALSPEELADSYLDVMLRGIRA